MNVIWAGPTPNIDGQAISVEFVVLHYTAETLKRTLELFVDKQAEVSAHLVIAENGSVFEIVPCLEGTTLKAWHAGHSKWLENEHLWQGFNDFSIGIELVNPNGNLLPYSVQQYEALREIVEQLRLLYPPLQSPKRIVGHEQIAGWRGKADPGHLFDWKRFFEQSYPNQVAPVRKSVCPPKLLLSMEKFLGVVPTDEKEATKFWHALSAIMETTIQLLTGSATVTIG